MTARAPGDGRTTIVAVAVFATAVALLPPQCPCPDQE